jgi:hypothetical protein
MGSFFAWVGYSFCLRECHLKIFHPSLAAVAGEFADLMPLPVSEVEREAGFAVGCVEAPSPSMV